MMDRKYTIAVAGTGYVGLSLVVPTYYVHTEGLILSGFL